MRKAINLDSTKGLWHYQLGYALFKLERWKDANTSLRNAINLDNKNAQWFYQLGCVLQKSNSWKKSSDAFQSAINLDNTNPQFYYKLRCVAEKNGLNAKDLNYVPVSVHSLFESLCVITEFLDDLKVTSIV